MRFLKRIVALSDTHGNLEQFHYLKKNNIEGDLFVHAGDFTKYSKQEDFQSFFKELEDVKFRHKIVVAGNHQVALDQDMNLQHKQLLKQRFPCLLNRSIILQKLRKRCIYLEHQSVEIQGVNIFGTPYSQSFLRRGAFQYTDENEEAIFTSIPDNIDILITHNPPFQILDKSLSGQLVGSKFLRQRVMQIRPKLHIFGHVHECHGITTKQGITFINAATQLKQFSWNQFV